MRSEALGLAGPLHKGRHADARPDGGHRARQGPRHPDGGVRGRPAASRPQDGVRKYLLRVGIVSPPPRRPDVQFAANRLAATDVGRELEVLATSSQTSGLQIRPPFPWPGSHGFIWRPTGVIRVWRRRCSEGLASLSLHPRGATTAARLAPDFTAPGSYAVSWLDSSPPTAYCPSAHCRRCEHGYRELRRHDRRCRSSRAGHRRPLQP